VDENEFGLVVLMKKLHDWGQTNKAFATLDKWQAAKVSGLSYCDARTDALRFPNCAAMIVAEV
jgi:hypothetical protein